MLAIADPSQRYWPSSCHLGDAHPRQSRPTMPTLAAPSRRYQPPPCSPNPPLNVAAMLAIAAPSRRCNPRRSRPTIPIGAVLARCPVERSGDAGHRRIYKSHAYLQIACVFTNRMRICKSHVIYKSHAYLQIACVFTNRMRYKSHTHLQIACDLQIAYTFTNRM